MTSILRSVLTRGVEAGLDPNVGDEFFRGLSETS